ncbi:acetylornithine/succinylornithine family transaminase [Candidatus Poribacteria bacterium]|nr:acetylornithine/succinylornithine family transaminase [Candidatus Poribacteria bacterium]
MASKYIVNTYGERPISLARGEGAYVWDAEGKKYLDLVAGIATINVGHCNARVVDALIAQARQLIHVSNLYYIEPQAKLAKRLVELSFADKCFFCNSGAEANEAAIKVARKYTKDKITKDKYEIITMFKSFHGRTMTTITATGQEKYHKGFEPMAPGFKYVPFNDLKALEDAVTDKTCAVMVEPIQAEGGINMPDDDYLIKLRKLCDDKNLLLIFDEVQTAMGRLGTLFGYESYGVEPDIMTMAKALGGGVPIGCMATKDHIAESLSPGTHASTFGGNPLVCSAALASLNYIVDENLPDNALKVGGYVMDKLKELMGKYPVIKEVRGKGLLIGMELKVEGKGFVMECMKEGLILNCIGSRIIRIAPPLIISEKHVDEALPIMEKNLANL